MIYIKYDIYEFVITLYKCIICIARGHRNKIYIKYTFDLHKTICRKEMKEK